MPWAVTRLLMAFCEAQTWGGNSGHAMDPAPCLIPAQCVQFPNNCGSSDTQGLLYPFRPYWSPRDDFPALILHDGPGFGELGTCLRISNILLGKQHPR